MVWWNLILLKYMQHLQDCQIKCFHSIQLAECFIFFSFLLFFFNKYPYFPWTARLSSGKCTSLVYLGFPISSSTLRLMSGVPAKLPSLLVEKKSLYHLDMEDFFFFWASPSLFFPTSSAFPKELEII